MAIPYTQPSMALVRAVDGTFISYPFIEDGDTTTKVYNLVCTQRASDYDAAQIELDDTMGSANNAGVIDLPSGWADSSAYFVGDTGHTPVGGGMISFTRTFCNLPKTVVTPSGTESFSFPGILNGNNTVVGMESISLTLPETYDTVVITTAAPHGLQAGGVVQLRDIVYEDTNGDAGTVANRAYTSDGESNNVGDGWFQYVVDEIISATEFKIVNFLLFDNNGSVGDYTVFGGEARNPAEGEFTITGAAISSPGIKFTTQGTHTIGVGQQVNIDANFSVGTDTFYHSVSGRYTVISTPSSSTFVVDIGLTLDGGGSLNLTPNAQVIIVGYEREPVSLSTPTMTRYDYYLPGVSPGISSIGDITIQNQFAVVDRGTGKNTNTTKNRFAEITFPGVGFGVLDVIWGTNPNCTSYISMVGTGANLVISSSLSKWAGNIYVKKTKTCQAQ